MQEYIKSLFLLQKTIAETLAENIAIMQKIKKPRLMRGFEVQKLKIAFSLQSQCIT